MERIPEVELIAAAVLGYVVQWARAYKAVNNWLAWGAVGLLSAVFWIWATPNALVSFQGNWRTALISVVMFGLSASGAGRLFKDTKAAPAANTK